MVLVDTSVWIGQLREGNARMADMLNHGEVMCHPFVIGEIACGNINNRAEILVLLQTLTLATQEKHEEVMEFIEANKLMGRGLGYVDMHLSASAKLTGVPIWTLDRRLDETSEDLGI